MLKSWREFSHCTVPVVKARIEQIIQRVTGPNVIEIGCNEGFVSKAIQEERGFNVVPVDVNPKIAETAKNTFGLDVLIIDGSVLPFESASFDTVLLCEVLEHVQNPGRLMFEAFRVARNKVIITVPIGAYWLGEASHLWQIEGCVIGHEFPDTPFICKQEQFLMEFIRRREKSGDAIN